MVVETPSNVVFVIESTANLASNFDKLKSSYILPTLEHFNGGPIVENDFCGDYGGNIYCLVIYHSIDHLPEPTVSLYTPTSNAWQFLKWIEHIPFVGGGGEGSSLAAEGLGAALGILDDLKTTRDQGINYKQQCVLFCNTPPFDAPIMEGPWYMGYTADEVASKMAERGVNLSVVSPRKLYPLQRLFERALGDVPMTSMKDYSVDPHHMVLLKGFQLKEQSSQVNMDTHSAQGKTPTNAPVAKVLPMNCTTANSVTNSNTTGFSKPLSTTSGSGGGPAAGHIGISSPQTQVTASGFKVPGNNTNSGIGNSNKMQSQFSPMAMKATNQAKVSQAIAKVQPQQIQSPSSMATSTTQQYSTFQTQPGQQRSQVSTANPTTGNQISNPGISISSISNISMANSGIVNSGMTNQGMVNTSMANKAMSNQGMVNTGMANTNIPNQGMANTSIANQGMANQVMANSGMNNQSMPNQNIVNQGMPSQGIPNQGMANQMINQGMANQGMANQGMANQGMNNQGMTNQGMNNQVIANQGMTNQGMNNQGMTNQGMPNQGMNNQGMANQNMMNRPVLQGNQSMAQSRTNITISKGGLGMQMPNPVDVMSNRPRLGLQNVNKPPTPMMAQQANTLRQGMALRAQQLQQQQQQNVGGMAFKPNPAIPQPKSLPGLTATSTAPQPNVTIKPPFDANPVGMPSVPPGAQQAADAALITARTQAIDWQKRPPANTTPNIPTPNFPQATMNPTPQQQTPNLQMPRQQPAQVGMKMPQGGVRTQMPITQNNMLSMAQKPNMMRMSMGRNMWKGVLEWNDRIKASQDLKITRSLNCNVTTQDESVKMNNWPQKLVMQIIPPHLLTSLKPLISSSKQVLFNFPADNDPEALNALNRVMASQYAGCVHFEQRIATQQQQSRVTVLMLYYVVQKKQFMGLIPNDQARFIQEFKNIVSRHKKDKNLQAAAAAAQQQQQQQMQPGQPRPANVSAMSTAPINTNMGMSIPQPQQQQPQLFNSGINQKIYNNQMQIQELEKNLAAAQEQSQQLNQMKMQQQQQRQHQQKQKLQQQQIMLQLQNIQQHQQQQQQQPQGQLQQQQMNPAMGVGGQSTGQQLQSNNPQLRHLLMNQAQSQAQQPQSSVPNQQGWPLQPQQQQQQQQQQFQRGPATPMMMQPQMQRQNLSQPNQMNINQNMQINQPGATIADDLSIIDLLK